MENRLPHLLFGISNLRVDCRCTHAGVRRLKRSSTAKCAPSDKEVQFTLFHFRRRPSWQTTRNYRLLASGGASVCGAENAILALRMSFHAADSL